MSDRSEHINEYDPIDDNNSVALDADDEEIENRTHSTNISQLAHSKVVNDGLESVHDSFARTQSDWADRKICKRRVVDFSSGEEDHIPSHQRLTHKGGYAHTKTSRLKISQANSGNIPWNKGKNRTSDAKAKISAGVRARNHAVLLKKLEKLGMTEEEWMSSKRKIKLLRERVRKARFAVEKEGQLRELRRLERRKSDQKERALRKLLAKQEESEDDDVPNFPDSESDVDSDKELMSQPAFDDEEMISTAEIIDDTLESEDKSMAEDKLQSNNEVEAKESANEVNNRPLDKDKKNDEEDCGENKTPSIFIRDFYWTPHPLDSTEISYKDLCPYGGPGGLICCESCTANYSKLLSKSYRSLEEQRIAKVGEELSELLKFASQAKQTLAQTVCVVRTKPVPYRDRSNAEENEDNDNTSFV